MAVHVAIEHRTTYRYDRLVTLAPHLVRLRPAPHARTPIRAYTLEVAPEEHFVAWQQDPFGNHVARFVFPERTRELDVRVEVIADLTPINPFDFFLDDAAAEWPVPYDERLARQLRPYLRRDEATPLFRSFLAEVDEDTVEGRRTIDVLVDLNRRIQERVAYDVRMEPGVQSPHETLARRIGSCRDSSWLLVQVLRHLGLAARFASGYLVQLTADRTPLDGPAGPAEDFTDLHAWAEVFVPGAGWIGLDPTSGLLTGEGHIPLACTPEPSSAAPIEGSTSETEVEFSFVNRVTRIHEDPRVTRPYDDEQWAAIDALGRAIDERLRAGDVRLTQGGEPTFVSLDDRESAQWSIAADGPGKRELAWELAQRLAARFAPGGLVQEQQGKWYPGEELPRWQLAVQWRTDGEPLWRDPDLLADPWSPGDADVAATGAVARGIASRLGVSPAAVQPAFEDVLHQLWQEALLPAGDPPTDAVAADDPALRDAARRAALVASLDERTGQPVGQVLPLRHDGTAWVASRWAFRRGRLHLVPGTSPMGLRLPLQSVAWEPPPPDPDEDPFAPRDPLAQPHLLSRTDVLDPARARRQELLDADGSLSALCVEERDGRIHVFLPPVTRLEHLVELLVAVEDTAAHVDVPVVVEGYGAPDDPRLRSLSVAPDPGVIEVNVHPAASWDELREVTEGLYEDAHHARLSPETFDLDGTHAGTGGGNHITLGGPTPADSPLLREPRLLRSIITYWQHHPSLSYLFSSRFVGPTSQAPRVDEGRDDRIGQLQVALDQLDGLVAEHEADGSAVPLWTVDRLLRHLLTDLTGNTHRAELCIDKLYSPDSTRGRLGLLELRGFEMPPHERMALVQGLLVRSLVARLWEDPYRAGLARWGSLLHDRFMLPWHVERDSEEVVTDLRAHDIAFEAAWLAPFHEFRFPRLGTTRVATPGDGGVVLELRRAIEPWDVLGEEVTAQGTARFVDSSMERVQVLVRGDTPGRHVVTVNGVPLPLHPTQEPGTTVAGIRYRAWHPPSGLHPTIGVHAPLRLDVVDRWNARSLGGCTYHVVPPNGRAYDTRPVNASEADSRRVARFVEHGHTPGHIDLARLDRLARTHDPESPQTLDLRTVDTA